MITLQEICSYFDELLQVEVFKDYCPNGLQVQGAEKVGSVATAVSASLETIERAVELGVDLLLVHHGMFWKGDDYRVSGVKRRKLQLLMENNISLLAYHLPLDAHSQLGNNWHAARSLGWRALEPFGLVDGMHIGVKGRVESQPVDVFQAQLEAYYQHTAHVALGGKQSIDSAALVSGGAHKSICEAVAAGVDCFITGSFDEPIWHIAKEEGIHFFALGHHNTEVVGPRSVGKHIEEKWGLKQQFLNLPNPF